MREHPDPESVKDLLARALELPATERESFLQGADATPEVRDEVRALLAALAAQPALLSRPTLAVEGDRATVSQPDSAPPDAETAGTMIDRYKLLQQIGEGGFGVVWMAQQLEPVHRRVALKVIKLGMDTRQVIARFEGERQALAMMEHPNIARVLDGGMTPAGRPYFVMELVKGVPITAYCDEAKLSVNQRLELFQRVCHAVQHAHQKGIIHRDLKPANVLVTQIDGEPVPKVIDFGIAKATAVELTQRTVFTEFHQMIGTPEYMSPEQAQLSGVDVDTRADVYSLGVLLYELLTGTKPFDRERLLGRGYLEMIRVIREEEPPKPSTRVSTLGAGVGVAGGVGQAAAQALSRRIRGDLDWIIMRAMDKTRDRRYATALELAADIGRHIKNEPVLAGPPSARYRLLKYVRRHRVVVSAVAIVVCALVTGLAAATWGFLEASDQRDHARKAEDDAVEQRDTARREKKRADDEREVARAKEREARLEASRANMVIDMLQGLLRSANPEVTRDKDYTMRAALDEFDQYLAGKKLEHLEVLAMIRNILGQGYMGLGLYEKANACFQIALRARRTLAARGTPTDVAESLNNIGSALNAAGNHAAAKPVLEEALALLNAQGADGRDRSATINNLAIALKGLGKLAEAAARFEEANALLLEFGDEHKATRARILNNLSAVLADQEKLAESEKAIEESIRLCKDVYNDSSALGVMTLLNLAALRMRQKRFADAVTEIQKALSMAKPIFADNHPTVLECRCVLASALIRQGRIPDADEVTREGLAAAKRSLPVDDRVTEMFMQTRAQVLIRRQVFDEAEALIKESIRINRARYPTGHPVLRGSINVLLSFYASQRRYEEAEPLAKEALESARQSPVNERNEAVAFALNAYATVVHDLNDYAKAEKLYEEALEFMKRLDPEVNAIGLPLLLQNLAMVKHNQQKDTEAEPMFRDALAKFESSLVGRTQYAASVKENLARVLVARGQHPEAETLFREALPGLINRFARGHPYVLQTRDRLASVLRAQQKYDAAADVDLGTLKFFRTEGRDDTELANRLIRLGFDLVNRKEYVAAEPLLEECLKIRKREIPESWLTYNTMSVLGAALSGQEKFEQAEPLLLNGYRKMIAVPETPLERKLEALQRLCELYTRWGRSEEEARWTRTLEEMRGKSGKK